jgi:hypothetical protein
MLGGLIKSVGRVLAPIAPIAPIIGAGLSYLGGRAQNVASAQAAQRQMDFQREASDTSYQRQVADLKAAGINPMLVSRLGGASTPAGAMPQFVNPGFQAGQIFSGMQSSAASAQQAATQEELSKPQMELVKANIESIKDAGNNDVWDEESMNNPIITECYEKNTKILKKEYQYAHTPSEAIPEIFDFDKIIEAVG